MWTDAHRPGLPMCKNSTRFSIFFFIKSISFPFKLSGVLKSVEVEEQEEDAHIVWADEIREEGVQVAVDGVHPFSVIHAVGGVEETCAACIPTLHAARAQQTSILQIRASFTIHPLFFLIRAA